MAWWRRVMKVCLRQTLCVIVVMGSFVGSLRTADASCGDHLAMAGHQSFSSAPMGRGVHGLPSRLPVPCHGPQCRGWPSIPVPVDVPVISIPFRQDLVPVEEWRIDVASGKDVVQTNGESLVATGVAERLERPPERT